MRKNTSPFAQTEAFMKLATGGRLRKVRNIRTHKMGQILGTITLRGADARVFQCAGAWHLSRPLA